MRNGALGARSNEGYRPSTLTLRKNPAVCFVVADAFQARNDNFSPKRADCILSANSGTF
jgi:hypothetical protein